MSYTPSGIANIKTPYTAFEPVTQQQTIASGNQSHANMMAAANPRWAMRQFAMPGVRTKGNPYALAQAMPAIGAASIGAAASIPQQQFKDDYTRESASQQLRQATHGDTMGQWDNLMGLQNPMGNQLMQQFMQLLMG